MLKPSLIDLLSSAQKSLCNGSEYSTAIYGESLAGLLQAW